MADHGTVYFQPSEVTIMLAVAADADPREYRDEDGLRIALRKLLADPDVDAPLHQSTFERRHGGGPRPPIFFRDPLGTRILQTVNLASWDPNPEDSPGQLEPALQDVIDIVARLQRLRPGLRGDHPYTVGPYTFLGASPNWLTVPMQDFAPPGGPGGLPVAVNSGPAAKKHPRFRNRRGAVVDSVSAAVDETLTTATGGFNLTGTADGHGVRIAVFDTWPMDPPPAPWTRGDAAQNGLGKIQDFRDNTFNSPISRTHLDEAAGGQLVDPNHIYDYIGPGVPFPDPADPVVAPKPDCNNGNQPKRRYNGSDHGLFIAGILHDLAPQAELHIYRVMDGLRPPDFYHVAEAMNHAATTFAGAPLIFNCSFSVGPEPQMIRWLLDNIALVYANDAQAWLDAFALNVANGAVPAPETAQLEAHGLLEPIPGTDPEEYQFTGEMAVLQELISTLQRNDILIVAAAGNDHCPTLPARPLPRLPAAIEDVLGVSASIKSGALAKYSNLDDFWPADDGVTALGGNVVSGRSTTGLYSLFVSDTVPIYLDAGGSAPPPNKTGLARWSGTSFATPVVAGLAACLWSEMSDPITGAHAPAQDVLKGITNHWPALQLKQGGWHV